MRAKVVKVRWLGYIKAGKIESRTSFFSVDKGATDIWMVYNGTSCGLNNILYAPHFGLPTIWATLRAILPGFFQCDLDVQDKFLNYKLHKSLWEYSGVDIQGVRSLATEDACWEKLRPARWERWERNWMGLRDSPYRSLQWQVRLKLVVYGDRKNLANPFHWDHVRLNLPGLPGYRADLPWVMKIRADGSIAAEIFVYVDDRRAMGHSAEMAWQAARFYAAMCARRGVEAYLGLQDAGAVGRQGHAHGPRPSLRDGLTGKVGEDSGFDMGTGRDSRAGPPSFAVTLRDQGVPYLCGSNIPMAKPLHQGATPHGGFLEAREGVIGFQAEREGVGESDGDLDSQPGTSLSKGGQWP